MDRRAWWAIVHGVTKSWTLLSDFQFFAFQSCNLAWEIPGTEEPNKLKFMRSQKCPRSLSHTRKGKLITENGTNLNLHKQTLLI